MPSRLTIPWDLLNFNIFIYHIQFRRHHLLFLHLPYTPRLSLSRTIIGAKCLGKRFMSHVILCYVILFYFIIFLIRRHHLLISHIFKISQFCGILYIFKFSLDIHTEAPVFTSSTFWQLFNICLNLPMNSLWQLLWP